MSKAKPDTIIRRYVSALHDPSVLVNGDEVAATEQALAATDDPLERLLLRSRLSALAEPDITPIEEQFCSIALDWAKRYGVEPEAFIEEGIPVEVLRRAGFSVRRPQRRQRRAQARPSVGTTPRRSVSRPRADVGAVMDRLPSDRPFTSSDVAEASGLNMSTARRLLRAAVRDGLAQELGSDPDHQGSGRPPTLYMKAK